MIVILGPTGVGKTELCLGVAEYFHIPIINADSRQIFRDIPIGTAAPTTEQQQRVKHFLVADHDICDYYSASSYEQDALELITKQLETSDFALLTGGSMMYIDAVCNGIDDIPTIREDIRTEMRRRYAEEGLDALVEELRRLDPCHYEIVDKKNYRRVIHALEICHQTGRTYTSFRKGEKKERHFNIIKIGLDLPREELYERINTRVDSMISEGLVEEARRMLPFRNENALNTVGYKEIFAYFDGIWQLDEAIERIKGNTRRYCRKQLTWFKRDKEIRWFSPNNVEEIINYIESVTN
ncbi:MAG: tRNA (adenosine(37)-N6)-dimethylallyltransferase MiaA [Prevotella sp.]|uniref:tRNA (adenosine(37)-N6)-dimethylallyltransferase MiaA n=1 Tax=Prevotella sp. TaxID=59823 RepID=UPI002A35287F|nr:tRNA (adenosine(37)-N6)-dimethylallyltransferase MiaA [Prevotella sp.]MDD7318095.1 tRNA (adenosine(37)-N6)-dimethylallyltransferase MiaA [Prevotellaceae bacterium]MDY4021016.1 tRNA (adenosine(37)-N6)-dimethylallyltransferase MiaA [Prevotella sp.]